MNGKYVETITRKTTKRGDYLPSHATAFHMIGQCDIIAPNIELPLSQAKHTAQYIAGVYTNSHVHIESGCVAYEPFFSCREWETDKESKAQKKKIYFFYHGCNIPSY